MKILILYRLARYFATYHFLSSLVIFFVLNVNEVSGRTDLKTKLLLQNIRTHLAQKADEIIKKKECESGLVLCANTKEKQAEENEGKSGEIPPPVKVVKGQHKPIFKVNTKDVIQTLPKAHKNLFRKVQRIGGEKNQREKFHFLKTLEESKETLESDEKITAKAADAKKTPETLKKAPKVEVKIKKGTEVKTSKVPKEIKNKADLKHFKKTYEATMKTEKDKKFITRGKITGKTKAAGTTESEKKYKKKDESGDKMEEALIFRSGALVFILDSSESNNSLCEKHSQIYVKQLKKYQIWALMMFDASAKLTSGILQGNTNQYGDFDECLAINAVFKKSKIKSEEPSGIKGKYCLANIDVTTDSESENLRSALERAKGFQFIKSSIHDPGHFIPRFSTINWGVCVPSACLAKDVETFLKSRFEILTNATRLHFDVVVDESNCVVKDDLKFQLQAGTMLTIMFYLAVLAVSLYATFVDTKKKKDGNQSEEEKIERRPADTVLENEPRKNLETVKFPLKSKTKEILLAFSIKKNMEKLLSDNNKGTIECINGVKSIFTIMLYLAHKTIPLGMTPFTNRIFLTKISYQPITILLRASIIYTDSFLLISGVLTSYNLAKEISEKKKISWLKRLFGRFIRLTPALLAVILFYAYIWDNLGSGPVWNLIVNKNSSLCRKYLWRNLLYIQNLFDFENMCAPQTHQLALDMQLSLLAPLFVHLIHTYDKAGVGILQALFILSSIMRYISTSNHELSVIIYHGMPVSQLYKTANLLYGQMVHRASPYILGTIVGYHLKKFEKRVDMPKAFAALVWIMSFTFGFYSVVSSSHLASKAYQYDVQEAAQYAALSPVAWSLALSWLIAACHLGYGGILNEFLCQKIFLIFSRISYSVYLTQFLVFFYKVGTKRIPEVFTFTGSFNATEFFLVIGISVIVALFFDIPMMEIKKIILDKSKPPLRNTSEDMEQNVCFDQSKLVPQTGNEKEETPEKVIEPTEEEKEYEGEDENENGYGNEYEKEAKVEGKNEGKEEEEDDDVNDDDDEEEDGNEDEEEDENEDEEEDGNEDEEGDENEDEEEDGNEDEEEDENEDEEEDGNEDEEGDEEDKEDGNEDEEGGENEDADVSGGDEEEIDEGDVEEVFEIRPLRRSLRMNFRDDSDDKECFMTEPKSEENEQKY